MSSQPLIYLLLVILFIEPLWAASDLHSIQCGIPTQIEIDNRRSSPVTIYWVDFWGKESSHGDLNPGSSQVNQTFATHLWRVRDKRTGQLLKIVVAGESPEFVAIDDFPEAARPSQIANQQEFKNFFAGLVIVGAILCFIKLFARRGTSGGGGGWTSSGSGTSGTAEEAKSKWPFNKDVRITSSGSVNDSFIGYEYDVGKTERQTFGCGDNIYKSGLVFDEKVGEIRRTELFNEPKEIVDKYGNVISNDIRPNELLGGYTAYDKDGNVIAKIDK